MKEKQDYIRDIAEIRSMMERSSRFLSLSGWAGVMAGIYALAGALVAYYVLGFDPGSGQEYPATDQETVLVKVALLATLVLMLAISTAIFLSSKKAGQNGEKAWNPTVRRLVINMAVPLITGGILSLIFLSGGMVNYLAPFTLIFYGLALYNASNFTYGEVKFLGLIQIALGLIASCLTQYGLLLWALGFGVVHIIYGIYIHYRYQR